MRRSFRALFLFLFNTGFVLMLMDCADLFYIMCPSGLQETDCFVLVHFAVFLLYSISSNTSPIDSNMGLLFLLPQRTMQDTIIPNFYSNFQFVTCDTILHSSCLPKKTANAVPDSVDHEGALLSRVCGF